MLIRTESDLQKLVRMSLAHFFDKKCHFEKEHGDQFTTRGVADIVGHIAGKYVAIECKMAPSGYPTKEQLAWMKRIHNTGAIALYIIYDREKHLFYFVDGSIDTLSYRLKHKWASASTVEVHHDGEKFSLINMLALTPFLMR